MTNNLFVYPFEIKPLTEEEGGGYLISFPDFNECISDGETPEEAMKNGFDALQETIDTTSSGGKLVFHMFGALAEFERNLIQERTKAGLAAARARGKKGGRPKALNNQQRELAVRLYNERKNSIKEMCEMMKISKPTLYSYLYQEKSQQQLDKETSNQ